MDACIADTPADELGGLGAEVEDWDGFVVDVGGGHGRDPCLGPIMGCGWLCGELGESVGARTIWVDVGTGG